VLRYLRGAVRAVAEEFNEDSTGHFLTASLLPRDSEAVLLYWMYTSVHSTTVSDTISRVATSTIRGSMIVVMTIRLQEVSEI
jgi:hypothetical protein